MKSFFDSTEATAEYAAAIKSICDREEISQDDLVFYPYIRFIQDGMCPNIKWTKRIPVKCEIPESCAPKKGSPHLLFQLDRAPQDTDSGRGVNLGLTEGEITTPYSYKDQKPKKIKFWRFYGMRDYYPAGNWVFIVQKKDFFDFAKSLLRLQKKNKKIETPILSNTLLTEIYDNTIGFLARDKSIYNKYNIPFKRGVLMCGPPGNGKTLTCKWLKQICQNKKYSYKIVTMQMYLQAKQHGIVRDLFLPVDGKKGIIFFDDMDQAVKSRESGNLEIATFLTNLDGIEPTEGAVYVFATNYIKDLDEAFVRPGRIDVFIPFRKPTTGLRKKFIKTLFPKEILKDINVEELVEETDDHTFAELEEIRKLLCMRLIDNKSISLNKTLKQFKVHRTEFQERLEMGFGAGKLEDDEDDDYLNDDCMNEPPVLWDL